MIIVIESVGATTNTLDLLRTHFKITHFLATHLSKPLKALWQFILSSVTPARRESNEDGQTDALVLQQFKQQRVEKALQEHGDAILRLAYSYLHNMADAEDMLQEVLLQLLRKAPIFESSNHEKAWLFRVTINLCKNKIKYNRRRRWEELSESLACEVQDDLAYVWEVVGSLPLKYREVIHLFYQEDMSTAHMASLLNKQESTIRSLLRRARILLKEQLKEGYDFEE